MRSAQLGDIVMDDVTMAAAESRTEARGNPAIVGMNPLGATAVGGGLVAAVLVLLMVLIGPVGGPLILLVLGVMLVIVLGYTLVHGMASLLNLRVWLQARTAIKHGDLVPGWVVRNASCSGIAMVDEGRRLVWLNGLLVPFESVERLSAQPKGVGGGGALPRLRFTVQHSSATRVISVAVDTNAVLESQYDRLSAALGLR